MPRDEIIKSKTTDDLTSVNKFNNQRNEQHEIRDSMVFANRSEDIGAMASKMADDRQKRKAARAEHIDAQISTLSATATELSGTAQSAYTRALSRMDDYEAGSARNFEIVNTLDSYLQRLDDTGLDGSEAYMSARDSISKYRSMIIKIDSEASGEASTAALEDAFNNMSLLVEVAIRSYEERGINSTYRRGGKRRVIFNELKRAISRNEQHPDLNGSLYNSFSQSLGFERIRENEATDEAANVETETQSRFEQSLEELSKLYTETQNHYESEIKDMKDSIKFRELYGDALKLEKDKIKQKGKERDAKIDLIKERITTTRSEYRRYINSNDAIKRPSITLLQKKEYEKRIARWKKIRSRSTSQITCKQPGEFIASVNYKNLEWPVINESITALEGKLPQINADQNPEYAAAVQNMHETLVRLKSAHALFMADMKDRKFNFKKGTSAQLEQDFENALEAVKAVASIRINKSNKAIVSAARNLKANMSNGDLASGFGELILVSSIRERYMYESREDMEKPLSSKEIELLTKPLTKKEFNKLKEITDIPANRRIKELELTISELDKKISLLESKADGDIPLTDKEKGELRDLKDRVLEYRYEKRVATEHSKIEQAEKIKNWPPAMYIILMGKLSAKQVPYDVLIGKYNVINRGNYVEGENPQIDELPEKKRTIPKESRKMYEQFKKEFETIANDMISPLASAPLGFDLVTSIEYASVTMQLVRRINRLIVKEYKAQAGDRVLSKPERYVLLYKILMNTPIGEACRCVNLMTTSCAIQMEDSVTAIMRELDRPEGWELAKLGYGNNLSNDIDKAEHEKIVKYTLSSPDAMMDELKGNQEIIDAEYRRSEKCFAEIFKGKKYSREAIAGFKGE